MMKKLILFIFPTVALLSSEYLTFQGIEMDRGETLFLISDQKHWIIREYLGGADLSTWELGDRVFYWNAPEYSPYEYKIFNIDHFSCYKIYFRLEP